MLLVRPALTRGCLNQRGRGQTRRQRLGEPIVDRWLRKPPVLGLIGRYSTTFSPLVAARADDCLYSELPKNGIGNPVAGHYGNVLHHKDGVLYRFCETYLRHLGFDACHG